ncbi:MAG TPA: hypothetical protein VIZ68_07960 [Thermoplasmata archaeon]
MNLAPDPVRAAGERTPGPTIRRWVTVGAVLFIVVMLSGIPTSSASVHVFSISAPNLPGGAPALGASADAVPTAAASVAPAAAAPFNPPCYNIDTGVCVSIQAVGESNIIPALGSFVSSVQPNCTSDLPLVIKSKKILNWPSAAKSGQKSPILLNVSGNLWNGDPYFSIYQGDYWHSDTQNVWSGPQNVSTNKSGYTSWYNVTISAKASAGAKNLFPGETVTWWIELTYNQSEVYIHHEGPHFVFTCAGAWPYSPYPGANQYAGASAVFEDLSLTVNPREPNWNDSVALVLNTTQADAVSNASIGQAWVDVVETSLTGETIATGTILFPISLSGSGFGATSTTAIIPASFAQLPGATVTYVLAVYDVPGDLLTTPAASYLVGANGTFLSGVFVDDLNVASTPSSVIAEPVGQAMLAPGQSLNITLTSRNLGTAISEAEVVAVISYPLLHEFVTLTRPLHRVSSTIFVGSIPGLPLGSFVNFTILSWDFTQRLEVSPGFGYYTPDFQTYDPILEANATFFYVFVYDNGSHNWVGGATVQITATNGQFNTLGNTTIGVAYPNQTRNVFLPLLLGANASYTITVNDPYFVPSGSTSGSGGGPVTVTIAGYHSMTNRQTLAQGTNYQVVQEGNAIVFWLNTTPITPTVSPTVPSGTFPIAPVFGLVAAALAAIPLALWWRQIRAKRKEEEKRVTL